LFASNERWCRLLEKKIKIAAPKRQKEGGGLKTSFWGKLWGLVGGCTAVNGTIARQETL